MKKKITAIAFLLLFVLFQLGYAQDLEVHFINVGQGDSIYIKTPDNQAILIDAGKHDAADDKYNPFLYLQSIGVKNIDAIFITHPHDDHYKGFKSICTIKGEKDFPVKAVYYSVEPGPAYGQFKACLNELVKNSEIHDQVSTRGPPLKFGDVIFTVLYPKEPIQNPNMSDKNLDSIVMKMTYKNVSVLFTGDTEKPIENSLTGDLKSTVLKVAHHGASTSTGTAFLQKVHPEYAIISSYDKDYGNKYGHPTAATLKSLKDQNVMLYRTDLSGNTVMKSDGETISVSADKEVSQSTPKLWKPGEKPKKSEK